MDFLPRAEKSVADLTPAEWLKVAQQWHSPTTKNTDLFFCELTTDPTSIMVNQ